ncbi:hypothetical protein MMPV_007376 [Pyropia vietnamensis]
MVGSAEDVTVSRLRAKLARKEADLGTIRKRIGLLTAGGGGGGGRTDGTNVASLADARSRYLNALAENDDKGVVHRRRSTEAPDITSGSDKVGSLASRWASGALGRTDVPKTEVVNARGDVAGARQAFNKIDTTRLAPGTPGAAAAASLARKPSGPAELLAEDDVELPSWAKNAKKVQLRKENAASVAGDVSIKGRQGDLHRIGSSSVEGPKEKVVVGGSVASIAAKWGSAAEEEEKARAVAEAAKRKEEKAAAERAKKQAEADQAAAAAAAAAAATTTSTTPRGPPLPKDEPTDIKALIPYLERKIELVEEDLSVAEEELRLIELKV